MVSLEQIANPAAPTRTDLGIGGVPVRTKQGPGTHSGSWEVTDRFDRVDERPVWDLRPTRRPLRSVLASATPANAFSMASEVGRQ